MSYDVWSKECFDLKILCTDSLFKKTLWHFCTCSSKPSHYKNRFAFPGHFFDLSTKYQLDECALHPEYNIVPDQIHPCAWLDVHWRWQAAFSLDMLNFDRWFSSYVCQNRAWRSLPLRLSRTSSKWLQIHLHSVQPARHQLRWIWNLTRRHGRSLLSFFSKQ